VIVAKSILLILSLHAFSRARGKVMESFGQRIAADYLGMSVKQYNELNKEKV
jgi:hypothetical protein